MSLTETTAPLVELVVANCQFFGGAMKVAPRALPDDGKYSRLEEHGFYWSASETNPGTAWFYNFGKGGQMLHRQSEGEKSMAISVRCVRHP